MKYALCEGADVGVESRPARGAWVEMIVTETSPRMMTVAPRKGRVG